MRSRPSLPHSVWSTASGQEHSLEGANNGNSTASFCNLLGHSQPCAAVTDPTCYSFGKDLGKGQKV